MPSGAAVDHDAKRHNVDQTPWVKIESWHRVMHVNDDALGSAAHVTYCSLETTNDVVDDWPGTGKTCELCYRKITRIEQTIAKMHAGELD